MVDNNGVTGDGQRQLRWQGTSVDNVGGGEMTTAAVADKKCNHQKLEKRWDRPATMKRG